MSAKPVRSNADLLRLAWGITKGWRGICYGPEFWLALLAWLFTAPYWSRNHWWNHVFSIAPTLLGLTITGFAIFLAFGSDDFKRFLSSGEKADDTPYMSTGAAFVIFVCVQLIAILFALVVSAFHFPTPDFLKAYRVWIVAGNYITGGIGYFLFIYSITLALRASLRIFRLSRWYMGYLRRTDERFSPKKMVQLNATKDQSGGVIFCAIASDGTAWYAEKNQSDTEAGEWRQMNSLPD